MVLLRGRIWGERQTLVGVWRREPSGIFSLGFEGRGGGGKEIGTPGVWCNRVGRGAIQDEVEKIFVREVFLLSPAGAKGREGGEAPRMVQDWATNLEGEAGRGKSTIEKKEV